MDWKPKVWVATLLGLFAPPLGFLYLVKPWAALVCFVAATGAAVLDLSRPAAIYGFLPPWFMVLWVVVVFTAFQCNNLARFGEPISHRKWYSRWWGLLSIFAGYFTVALLLRSFVIEPFRLPSASMYPSVLEGEYFLIKKWGYGLYGSYGIIISRTEPTEPISRGDILVFRLPQDEQVSYVKRVVGLPGDHVVLAGMQLTVNGKQIETTCPVNQPQVTICLETVEGSEHGTAYFKDRSAADADVVVPAGHYFMLGDSRNNSRDSRYIGFIPARNIVGRLVYVF